MEEKSTDTEASKDLGKKSKLIIYGVMHVMFLLYSLAAVCSKMAALSPFPSFPFFAWYFCVLCIFAVYAIIWQQVLKRLSLITAFANKGVTLIWGMLWGVLFFSESISLFMIIGAALVFVGILLVVTSRAN